MKTCWWTILGLAMAAASIAWPASADPVWVSSGREDGQGWISSFGDRCLVITTAHGIIGEHAEVVGPQGRRGTAVSVIRHPTLDLAVLDIQGELKAACPQSSLGFSDAGPVLAAARSGSRRLAVELTGEAGGTTVLLVMIDSIDVTAPAFMIRTVDEDVSFAGAGDSGAVVVEYGEATGLRHQPLGLVVEQITIGAGERRFARAIRFDEVRAFVETTFGGPSALTDPNDSVDQGVELLQYTGSIDSSVCGLPDLWRNRPGCTVSFVADTGGPPASVTLSPSGEVAAVSVRFAPGSTARGVAVETTREPLSGAHFFLAETFCRPDASLIARCSISSSRPEAIRLVFDGSAVVEHIAFERVEP